MDAGVDDEVVECDAIVCFDGACFCELLELCVGVGLVVDGEGVGVGGGSIDIDGAGAAYYKYGDSNEWYKSFFPHIDVVFGNYGLLYKNLDVFFFYLFSG